MKRALLLVPVVALTAACVASGPASPSASADGPTGTGAASAAAHDAGACLPVAELPSSGCPADWAATAAAHATFCATETQSGLFSASRTSEACRGWLRYTKHLFDGGPRYCLYDPSTGKLAAYGAFDGKAMYEKWTCGFAADDFRDDGCAGVSCEDLASDAGDAG